MLRRICQSGSIIRKLGLKVEALLKSNSHPMGEVLVVGTVLQERYKITRAVSSGSAGNVYEAVDNKITGSACLIYEYLPYEVPLKDRQTVQKKFGEIAEKLKTFQHPHLIR